MVMWSTSRTGGSPPGTKVSCHTETTRTHHHVPTSMIYTRIRYIAVLTSRWNISIFYK